MNPKFVLCEAFRDAARSLIAEAEVAPLEDRQAATRVMTICNYMSENLHRHVSEVGHELENVMVKTFRDPSKNDAA